MTTAGADLPAVHFATDALPSAERVPSWREFLERTVVRVDFERLRELPCYAKLMVRELPGLTVMSGGSGGLRTRRTRRHISDGNDDLVLRIHFSGSAIVSQRNDELGVGRGAVLLSTAEVAAVTIPAGARYCNLRMPRKALAALVPGIDDAVMRPIPRDSEALRLLATYVGATRGHALSTPEIRHRFVTHVTDLAALTIGAARDAAAVAEGRGLRAARLRAIKLDIASRLRSGPLTVTETASRQRISPRYVQMLFEAEGTTFSRYVLEQRLSCAENMLTDPRHDDWTITAIAFSAGFGDLSHFNHAFRRVHGAKPSEVREAARRAYRDVE